MWRHTIFHSSQPPLYAFDCVCVCVYVCVCVRACEWVGRPTESGKEISFFIKNFSAAALFDWQKKKVQYTSLPKMSD